MVGVDHLWQTPSVAWHAYCILSRHNALKPTGKANDFV